MPGRAACKMAGVMFRKAPKATKADMLAGRPMRSTDAEPKAIGDSAWQITVPLQPRKWANFLPRAPGDMKKTFELDEIGKFVWDQCDGKTNVRQIILKLARRYNLNERQAEVSTVAFLQTLTRRGLIGLAVRDRAIT